MPISNMRIRGVHGKNLPTKKTPTATPADFSIAGIIGKFERSYLNAIEVDNPSQERDIFGDQIDSSSYAKDNTTSFWKCVQGTPAKLFIKSHVGYNGIAFDGAVASANVNDTQGLLACLKTANQIITAMNAHAVSIGGSGAHIVADTVNFPLSASPATDLSSLITLVTNIINSYNQHNLDAKLTSPVFHKATEVVDHTLASLTPPVDFATCLTLLSDIKTKFNAHDADTTIHTAADSNQISGTVPTTTPVSTLQIQAAYQTTNLEYGLSGNRTGYRIETGNRMSTTVAATILPAATSGQLTSINGIYVGDIVVFNCTSVAGVVAVVVTAINQSTNTISWSGAFHATYSAQANDVVSVPGFKIHTYRKNIYGQEQEVMTNFGSQWCTNQSLVSQYYVQNVHQYNNYIKVTVLTDASPTSETMPCQSMVTTNYLSGGLVGTSPTTSSHWDIDLQAFNNLPVRMLSNCETTDTNTQKDGVSYCRTRLDTPIWISLVPDNSTKNQLIAIGNTYQQSIETDQVIVADWLGVTDPFNNNSNAKDRIVTNAVGVMGTWIYTINTLGIHYIPATNASPMNGVNSIDNSNLNNPSDQDRTDLDGYGINIMRFIPGTGYRMLDFYTTSTATEFSFANGILMRNFIKVSLQDSLSNSENTPNSIDVINQDMTAMRNFLKTLWEKGSTGNVTLGETFGQMIKTDGTYETFDDCVQIQGNDPITNPQSQLQLGNRTYKIFFSYPAPGGSIEIGVGILLKN